MPEQKYPKSCLTITRHHELESYQNRCKLILQDSRRFVEVALVVVAKCLTCSKTIRRSSQTSARTNSSERTIWAPEKSLVFNRSRYVFIWFLFAVKTQYVFTCFLTLFSYIVNTISYVFVFFCNVLGFLYGHSYSLNWEPTVFFYSLFAFQVFRHSYQTCVKLPNTDTLRSLSSLLDDLFKGCWGAF